MCMAPVMVMMEMRVCVGRVAWLGLAWLCSGTCVWLRECVWLCVWLCVDVCEWVRRGLG